MKEDVATLCRRMTLCYAGGCRYDILDGNARMAVALRRCCHILVTENSYTSFNVMLVYYSRLFTCIALCTISLSHIHITYYLLWRCVAMPAWGVRR